MKKDTEKEKWWAMNREERLRRQKEFLISFAFGAVWLVILWVVLKAVSYTHLDVYKRQETDDCFRR